jgi:uncharacterized protein YjbI with pentapeptide repeats
MRPSTILSAGAALLASFSLSLAAQPAAAQNANQVEHARAGASCPHCNLFQADFSNLELKDRDYAGARLRQSDMSAAVLNHTSFAGGDLRDINAYGAVMTGVSFAGANLTNASFVGAYLEGANFRGATLSGVNFSGAEMDRAVGLTQQQLAGACGDEATSLPRGLHIRPCG